MMTLKKKNNNEKVTVKFNPAKRWEMLSESIRKEIVLVMNRNNYRVAYEHAVDLAKKHRNEANFSFFPFMLALDIRGEKSEEFKALVG